MANKPRVGDEPRSEKLQKVLATAGLGSRREIERWISAGRVQVNGEVAHLGQRVGPADKLSVDGRRVRETAATATRVLVLNKAAGVVCTRRDPEGRPTIFDDLPKLKSGRWISIGRLDIQTTGLLLVTNDGELANRMMHPSTGLDREYAVRVDGVLDDAAIDTLISGVVDDGEHLAFTDVQYFDGSGTNHWYHAVLMEGKHHEVRRLFQAVGRRVSRLKRVRFGPVVMPSRLRAGKYQELSDADVAALCRLLKLTRVSGGRRGPKQSSVLVDYPELNLG